jgi:hypothetical protein
VIFRRNPGSGAPPRTPSSGVPAPAKTPAARRAPNPKTAGNQGKKSDAAAGALRSGVADARGVARIERLADGDRVITLPEAAQVRAEFGV